MQQMDVSGHNLPAVILFGAFDRHNFGDLLFPHIAQGLLGGHETLVAGLSARDLREQGGHNVRSLADVVAERAGHPAVLLHVGGEVLSCSAWYAALMLLPPEQLHSTVAYLGAQPQEQAQWIREVVGTADLAPYVAPREAAPAVSSVAFVGAGGVGLSQCEPALRDEVLAKLKAAHTVCVRDGVTLAYLQQQAVAARLIPDPASMVAELFGPHVHQRAAQGEVARLRERFPHGHLAVQFSTAFGDDDTLTQLAAQLDLAAEQAGRGVALFCAGRAPWHDDPAMLDRIVARMRQPAAVFASEDAWDVCAVIATSSAYAGSSLHGRIVAMAFGVPRINVTAPNEAHVATKQAAYATSWDTPAMPTAVAPHELAFAIDVALRVDAASLRDLAADLAQQYREAFDAIRASWQ